MIAIRGLRVIGLCAWVIVLFLYLGFWALALALPWYKLNQHLSGRWTECPLRYTSSLAATVLEPSIASPEA